MAASSIRHGLRRGNAARMGDVLRRLSHLIYEADSVGDAADERKSDKWAMLYERHQLRDGQRRYSR